MTDAGPTKAEWLARIEREAVIWNELVDRASASGFDRPGAAGDWTFIDVAGHLVGWRVRTIDRLQAGARAIEPPPPPWPAGLRDDNDEDLEAINRWFFEQTRQRSAEAVLAQAVDQFRQMREAVSAISETDLLTAGRFAWLDGAPLSAVLEGSFDHLHGEHEPALRAWLAGGARPG